MKYLMLLVLILVVACADTTGPTEVVEEVPMCTVFIDLSVWPVTTSYTGPDCSMFDTTGTVVAVNGDTLSG